MMDIIDIVITIGISGGVGLAILFYQRKLELKVDKIIEKQAKIIDEQHKREQEWRTIWGQRILMTLISIKTSHETFRGVVVDYVNNSSEDNKNRIIGVSERLGQIIEFWDVPTIKNDLAYVKHLFANPLLADKITKQCGIYPTAFKDWNRPEIWETDMVQGRVLVIEDILRIINEAISEMKNEIQKEEN